MTTCEHCKRTAENIFRTYTHKDKVVVTLLSNINIKFLDTFPNYKTGFRLANILKLIIKCFKVRARTNYNNTTNSVFASENSYS